MSYSIPENPNWLQPEDDFSGEAIYEMTIEKIAEWIDEQSDDYTECINWIGMLDDEHDKWFMSLLHELMKDRVNDNKRKLVDEMDYRYAALGRAFIEGMWRYMYDAAEAKAEKQYEEDCQDARDERLAMLSGKDCM